MVQRTTRARPHRQDREFGRFDDAREHEFLRTAYEILRVRGSEPRASEL